MSRKLELRQAFFREHTEAGFDGLPKITTAPHDLFEWMWQQCNIANVVGQSEQLVCDHKFIGLDQIHSICTKCEKIVRDY